MSRAGPDEVGTAPSVLAIGLESRTSRDGGLNRYFSQLVAALGELGTPVVGLVTGQARAGLHDDHVEILTPATASLTNRLRAIASGVKRHADTDVIDVHFALMALPVLVGSLRRRPLVMHFQGPWADESRLMGEGRLACAAKRRLERLVYRRADALVVLSRAFRRVLVEGYGVSPWDIHVIPPGVDTQIFVPGDRLEARAALRLPDHAFVALAVRRLVPRMGLNVLLEAWAEVVRSAGKPIVLCIVGAGPQGDALEARSAELGLKDAVRFVGRVDDEELIRYYQAADVSIVPSVALEGFGLVVLESLATGTPVVASAVDGLSEALIGLAPDLLVPPGEPHALAERLQGVITGGAPLPTAEECRRYAESFSWIEVARQHLDIYGQLVAPAAQAMSVGQRKLRVVILGHTAQLSGGELAIQRAMSALTGVQMHVILAQDGPLVPLLERAGASVEVLPMGEGSRNLRKGRVRPTRLPIVAYAQSVTYVLRLARRLARVRPDLVHTNTLKAALYGGLAARLAGVPCVWHVRDRIADDYLPSAAVQVVCAAARVLPTGIIANSRTTLASLRLPAGGPGKGSFGRVTAVIPSPVVVPLTARTPLSSTGESFRVAMVGRLAPWKGQDVFLQAFAQAFPEGEEVAVLVGAALFGEDDYERQLRELVSELGIEKRVEFRGFRSEVFEELARVDALVHASIIPEPFGQVVLEGMAAGLPVVAAGAGGPAEIIVEGETGLLYPPGDVDALASLLRRLADNPELCRDLGNRGRAAAIAYGPDGVAEQIRSVYERVVIGSISGSDGNLSDGSRWFRGRGGRSR
ncbi:MAG: glycosyltransferase family 4 protein [Acidimicrobiales bacterium]